MTQEWSDNTGADAFGENALNGLHKVKMLRAGEVKGQVEKIRKR